MAVQSKSFYQNLWKITYPFWCSREGRMAETVLLGALILLVFRLYVSVLINEWQKLFFNAIQLMDADECVRQLFRFAGLSLMFLPLGGCQRYLRGLAQIYWRQWLTEHYANKLLNNKNYFRLQYVSGDTDNFDQRIAEDLRIFPEETINMTFGFIDAMGSLAAFSAILWNVPGSPEIGGIKIHGFLFWLALFFSLAGTWVNHTMGKILSVFKREQQKFEADYRFFLVRLRENAEAIAAYGGEDREKEDLANRFGNIVGIWRNILRRNRALDWFFSGYNQLSFILPYVVMIPRFFSGAISLGDIQQSASAFSQTRMSFSWFIYNYGALAEWKATVDRIIGLEKAMDQTGALGLKGVDCQTGSEDNGMHISDLKVWLPNGRLLFQEINLDVKPGNRILIFGPSGCGKTTFFHTLKGLWPFCWGKISMPQGAKMLFVPQKPFLPISTLRQAIVYPDNSENYETGHLLKVLQDCGLPQLCDKLDEKQHWAQQLSFGEQQRLAFVRSLLLKPQWLFLDEVTSALDELSERKLYQLLVDELPNTAIISIAHKLSVMQFHDRKVNLI